MTKNYWQTFEDSLAYWFITFPDEAATFENMVEFTRGILKLGEQEQVLRVVNFDDPSQFLTERYFEHFKAAMDLTGRLEFLKINHASGLDSVLGRLGMASRVAYYDTDGKIREDFVTNLGRLLQQLRPDFDLVPATPPLEVDARFYLNKSDPDGYDKFFTISLYTDLWFPYLPQYEGDELKLMDNAELAYLHTPRLNRFMTGVHQLANQLGGKWEPFITSQFYRDWCTEDGIRLEARS